MATIQPFSDEMSELQKRKHVYYTLYMAAERFTKDA